MTDWKISVDELPNKDFRDKNNWISHSIIETDDQKYGFLFYNVVEFGMGWYAGAFAILTNKQNPIRLFDSKEFHFRKTFKTDFEFGEKSGMIQLVRSCYNQNKKISEHTFCLLDFKNQMFSILSFDCSDFYCLKEIDKNKFSIAIDKPDDLRRYEERSKTGIKRFSNTTIDCAKLLWTPIGQLENYNNIYWKDRGKYRLN
ncbi:MAG: hypothetical protein ACXVPW_16725 [Bacteroidia bacterium]